ncbi:MAG: hypothetical protein C5B49_12675 [Bdellovibrio sp.]|nr:MAG: hypothetical protein C5B49_12675 [Bdellovibrio sp.]
MEFSPKSFPGHAGVDRLKILVLSFLRLGDFFQQAHLLRAMTDDEIHVSGFDELAPAVPLFPEWRFHLYPRRQFHLQDQRRPWYRGAYLLEQLIESLDRESFHKIYNFTHTRFSARLMDCLRGGEKVGVQFAEGRAAGWTPALREFNDQWIETSFPRLSYIDFLAEALSLPSPPLVEARPLAGTPPQTGAQPHLQRPVWLQPLTSDDKKNWHLSSWRELCQRLDGLIVGAPAESDILRRHFPDCKIAALSLLEMKRQAEDCRLLISGDTSVLHFAVLFGIPTLGLFLGPANPRKTAPRQRGAHVLWPQAPCSPCFHSGTCHQARHHCAERLRADQVFSVAESIIHGKNPSPTKEFTLIRIEENHLHQIQTIETHVAGSVGGKAATGVPPPTLGGRHDHGDRSLSLASFEEARESL